MMLEKSLSDELFVRKFRILPLFSIIYLIRIRFVGARINSELVSGRTVKDRWVKVRVTMDSGAADHVMPEGMFPRVTLGNLVSLGGFRRYSPAVDLLCSSRLAGFTIITQDPECTEHSCLFVNKIKNIFPEVCSPW